MNGPLDGIKVIDCSIWMQGPMAAMILGDLGADVVKVEERGKGDPYRAFRHRRAERQDRPIQFESANRNKRSMTLDLRKEQGREVIYRLVETSDVFVHNLRTGAAERLGLTYDTLSRLNPKLIYSQASGWGLKGPEAEKGAFDLTAMARSGFMFMVGEVEEPAPPQMAPGGMCDVAGSMTLVIGTLAALQARQRTGRGQMVDSSIFGSIISLLAFNTAFAVAYGYLPGRGPRSKVGNPLCTSYQCGDGEWIQICMLQYDKYWLSICDAMGLDNLKEDPRFRSLEAVVANAQELIAILDQAFAAKARAEWMRIFSERDFIFAPIQRANDLAEDPQVLANDYVVDFDHPVYGPGKMLGLPYKFSETPGSIRRPYPEFGQHTEEVLLELGYNWDDIAKLRQEEII